MKKIILTLAIAISSFAVFASDVNVNAKVLSSFNREFAEATDVQWSAGDNFFKADFVYNSQHVSAFYDVQGEMLAMTRNISSLDLPIGLQTNLRKDYSDYWISDLFEVSNSEGTEYYITLEKADCQITLKSTGNGKWKTYRKVTKA